MNEVVKKETIVRQELSALPDREKGVPCVQKKLHDIKTKNEIKTS